MCIRDRGGSVAIAVLWKAVFRDDGLVNTCLLYTSIVGKFVGEDALAAVGTSNPLMTLAILFINGVCLGAGILVSLDVYKRQLLVCAVSDDADGGAAHDAQRQNAQQALCVYAALILLNPDGRLKLVCLLDEESCRSCMETNLILNQNVLLNTHCDSLSCK